MSLALHKAIKTYSTKLFFVAVMFFVPFCAYAQIPDLTNLNPETILNNISQAIPNLMRLITSIAYVLGMYMIIKGVVKLKHAGEARTYMSHEHHLGGPAIEIAIGALLLYLPTAVQIGMSTFWTNPNPYGYIEQKDQWQQFIRVCFMVVQFIGTVAFIRGLVILSHSSSGNQQGGLSRGLTHVIGGIFCINIYQFLQVIFTTLGTTFGSG